MTRRQRLISILIGIAGAMGSCFALAEFLIKVGRNALDIPPEATPQAFYRSVGKAYSGGFIAGFALCFSLMLIAVAVGTWFDSRRQAMSPETVRIPLVGPTPEA